MASAISADDCQVHGFMVGDHKGQQTWECLAVLVAARHWKSLVADPLTTWKLRTDNTTVIHMVAKLSTHGEGPALIARELALEVADLNWLPSVVEHVP
eukprot:1310277-Amphidinium_carterae.1